MSVQQAHPKTQLKFFFYENEQVKYDCVVDCKQCEAIANNGNRCRMKTCFSLPFCHIHLSKQYGVRVRNSTIPGAGRGLFATKDFNRNDIICPIWGKEKSPEQVQNDYGANITPPYVVELTRRKQVDGACHKYVGQMANTQLGADGKSSLRKSNASISVNHRAMPYKLFIKASKPIKAGDEIFVYYGESYGIPMNYEYKRVKRH